MAALTLAALLALVLTPDAQQSARAQDCAGADVADASPDALAAATLCLVNAARANEGLPALASQPQLAAAGAAHVADMAARGYFALQGPDGSTTESRVSRAGYSGASSVREAIFYGSGALATPRAAVIKWLSNQSERAIVLASAPHAGIGALAARGGPFTDGANVFSLLVGSPGGSDGSGDPSRPLRPVPGRSVVVRVISGTVLVTPPARGARSAQATELKGSAVIALGATIDTTRGRVRVTSAVNSAGATERGDFYAGAFVMRQRRAQARRRGGAARTLVSTAKLSGGDFARACGRGARAAGTTAGAAQSSRTVRRLWGSGRARYRTEGRFAAATVRGTVWLTEDRCDGTRVRVRSGVVDVRDRVRNRTIRLRAGRATLVRRR